MPKKHDMIRIDAIGVGVCLFVSLAVYLAWGHPFLRQRTLQIKQRSALSAQRQECSRLTELLAAVEGQLEIVEGELAQSRFDVESVDRINKRIAMLTTFFSDCQLSIDNVQAAEAYAGHPFWLIPINVTGTGSCRQCARFLHRFSNEFADMSVAAFVLTGFPGQDESRETFHLDLLWHAAPVAKESPSESAESTEEMVSKF